MRTVWQTTAVLIGGAILAGCNCGPWLAKKTVPCAKVVLGQLAPEIEGEDIEGAKFKLSDYRGKVVMLDFWGNW